MTDQELEQAIARLKPRHREWFNHLVQDPAQNATEAAKVAGLGKTHNSSQTLGSRLRIKYQHLIAAYNLRRAEADYMSPKQVLARLAEIARGSVRVDAQVMKALELLARIHGMLSEKLSVDIDSSSLRRELGSLAQGMLMARIPPSLPSVDTSYTVDAEPVSRAPEAAKPGQETQESGPIDVGPRWPMAHGEGSGPSDPQQ